MLEEKIIKSMFNHMNIKCGRDIHVNDISFFGDVFYHGSLGLGDSYVFGKWESANVDDFIFKVLSSGLYKNLIKPFNNIKKIRILGDKQNFQDVKSSKKVIEKHYNLDPNFFLSFLGGYNQYTCCIFIKEDDDLNQAEINKMQESCRKLGITRNDKILDIGCGWGGFGRYLSEVYEGIDITLVTLSKTQADFANEMLKNKKVRIINSDYRDIPKILDGEKFDKISALGVMEHVGPKNYDTFMNVVSTALEDDGLFLLQTIYSQSFVGASDPWLTKRIFPNGYLPSIYMIHSSTKKHFNMVIRDDISGRIINSQNFHDMTSHYEKTCILWNQKFNNAVDNGVIDANSETCRTMNYYFLSCAGAFRANHMKVGQFLFQK